MIIDPIISKNIALIKDANGKDIERIYDRSGNLVFKNWNTLEGPLPIECFTSSNKLRNYRIYGNTIQDGTPTPDNPVEVRGVGEYDAELNGYKIPVTVSGKNLMPEKETGSFSGSGLTWIVNEDRTVSVSGTPNGSAGFLLHSGGYINMANTGLKTDDDVTASIIGKPENIVLQVVFYDKDLHSNYVYDSQSSYTFKIRDNFVICRMLAKRKINGVECAGTFHAQLEKGTAPTSYEPYHEPITTPIYIGSEPLHKIGDYADYVDFKRGVVVRRIKKLVLTGGESWRKRTSGNPKCTFEYKPPFRVFNGICSHYERFISPAIDTVDGIYLYNTEVIIITDLRFTATTDFKSYLAAQYSAGTPVTIWYALAEPEEEILPLSQKIPTNIGSNTFSCTISPAPSKAMIQYKKK